MTLQRLVHGLQHHCDDTVQVVRPCQDERDCALREEHVLRLGLPMPGYAGLRFGLPSLYALTARWRHRPPDVVHVATEGPLGWSALRAAEGLGIPVTSSFHTNFHTYSQHYGVGFLTRVVLTYLRRFHNRCHCTMVPTAVQAAELATAGFRNTQVLGRGVDTVLFHPGRRDPALRAGWGAGPDDPVLLYVGRLAAEKNLALLLQTLDELRATRPELRLVLVGDGPERQRVAAHPGCILAGSRRGADLARHYASADCFCFPSMSETFGNVLTEAMASGLACLGFDYAAAHEVITDGRDGLLVPFGDADAFRRRAPALLGDPELIARL
ncbi:MAG: glycosyltransferase family 4 protein, partial [Planctomycetota bacterium]